MAASLSYVLGIFCIAACLSLGGCDGPARHGAAAMRSCAKSDEGERTFAKYRPLLLAATDWEKVGWIKQVAVANWIACRAGIAHHTPIDDCLDRLGYDRDNALMPFSAAVERCVKAAQHKPKR
ncbi:MAG: hypothetical protein ACR2PI_24875 [Hyphomicrobiaceae bacterium]